jgi:hypothetical protein
MCKQRARWEKLKDVGKIFKIFAKKWGQSIGNA